MMDPKMVEEVSTIAAKAAIEHYEAERKRQQKVKRDRRLRNTKLLMKHYRTLKQHCEGDLRVKVDEGSVVSDLDDQFLAINSITRSKVRTHQMVKYIDQMLEIYRLRSEKSDDPLDLRQYKAMHAMYISNEPMTVKDIANAHFVDDRTVYRDVKEAIYQLSCLIFGIDGLRLID